MAVSLTLLPYCISVLLAAVEIISCSTLPSPLVATLNSYVVASNSATRFKSDSILTVNGLSVKVWPEEPRHCTKTKCSFGTAVKVTEEPIP